jgi:hypothetical protein
LPASSARAWRMSSIVTAIGASGFGQRRIRVALRQLSSLSPFATTGIGASPWYPA